jgi:hypothetical protein
MNKPPGNPPFYRNRNWLIGFIVTLAAVLLFYYLQTRPSRIQNAAEPIQGQPSPTAQVGAVLATPQPETGWKAGITFTAPGTLPSDLLRVGEEVWIFTEEGKKLVRVNLKGEMLSETALEGFAAKQPGMAGGLVHQYECGGFEDRSETGKVLSKFETDTERKSIAWDGKSLWIMVQRAAWPVMTGREAADTQPGGELRFARDLAFKEDGLWAVYIPPLLAQYDASFKLVNKTDATCGVTKGVLDYAIDWDGESLWYVDFISGQVTQCIAVNQ